jgi:hypothetical protein
MRAYSKLLLYPAEVAHELEECHKFHLQTRGVERHHQVLDAPSLLFSS